MTSYGEKRLSPHYPCCTSMRSDTFTRVAIQRKLWIIISPTSCQFSHMHLLLNTGIPVTRAWVAWPVTTIGGVIPVSTVFYEISREWCSPRKDTGGPRTHYDLSPVFDRAQLLIASPHTIAHRHGMAIKIVASQIYLYPILPFHTRSSLLDITLVSKK